MSDSLQIAIEEFEKVSKTSVHYINRLGGSTGNDVYLINWLYVFRVKKENKVDEQFNRPTDELLIIQSLAKDPRSPMPRVLTYDPRTGYKSEEYIPPNRVLSEIKNREDKFQAYCQVLFAMKQLHSFTGPFEPFKVHDRFDFYKMMSGQKIRTDYETQLRHEAEKIIENDRVVLCHNDLWQGNIVLTDGDDIRECYLIDYEFAANNGEIFDLASFLEENEVPFDVCKRLINRYYGAQNVTDTMVKNVFKVMEYEDLFWYYWAYARYQETLREDFLEISKAKFKRVNRNIKRWSEAYGEGQ